MKKLVFVVLGVMALVAFSSTAAFAGPPSPPIWGRVDPLGISPWPFPPELIGVEKIKPPLSAPGGQVHIVTDPLVATPYDEDANGTVTFWCQSQVGFQYHIVTSGLEPVSAYAVSAVGWRLTPDPLGPDIIEGESYSIVGPVELDLGMLHADPNGLGAVHGVKKLAPDSYDLVINIKDAGGNLALASDPLDPQDFVVY
jgi:hypothetical protein